MRFSKKRSATMIDAFSFIIMAIIAIPAIVFFAVNMRPPMPFIPEVNSLVSNGDELFSKGHNSLDDDAYAEIRQLTPRDTDSLLKMTHIYKDCDGRWNCTNSWMSWEQAKTISSSSPGSSYSAAEELIEAPTTLCNMRYIKSDNHNFIPDSNLLCVEKETNKALIWKYSI